MTHGGAPARRIGLLGLFGVDNYGNEATLDAALSWLAQDGCAPVVLADNPEAAARHRTVPAWPIYADGPREGLHKIAAKLRDARQAWRQVRQLDGLVVPGTGLFEGQWFDAGGVPLTIFWYAFAARLQRVPFAVVSVGADRITTGLSRALFRASLRRTTYLSVRDDGSARAVASLGLPTPVVVPDLVLGRAAPAPVVPSARLVVVGVMDYLGERGPQDPDAAQRADYVDRTIAVVEGLRSHGFEVRIVVGAAPDLPLAREVERRTGAPLVGVGGHDATGAALAGAQVVVAARFHTLIAALTHEVPVVSVGYGPKQQWLLEAFGFGDRVHTLAGFNPDEVVEDVARAVSTRAQDVQVVRGALARARAEQREQWVRVADVLGVRAPGEDPPVAAGALGPSTARTASREVV